MRIALIAPEYRSEIGAGQGGVATVVDFIRTTTIEAGWHPTIFSVRMSHRATESRRLLAPSTWGRRPLLRSRPDGLGYEVGSQLAEVEQLRYRPNRDLDAHLDDADVVIVVAGSPALAHVASRTRTPVILQVATMVDVERARLIATSRGAKRLARRASTWATSRQDRSALRIPRVVVTENEWMTRRCVDLEAREVILCPPGVDTEVFSPGEGPEPPCLLMVARLSDRRKDLPTLFRAYSVARELGCELPLVLAGRQTPPTDDMALADALGITEHLRIESDVTEERLVDLLRSARLFVLASSEEGLGLALVEALATGTPIVTTATEGAKYVLAGAPDAGELLPVGDADALGRAIAAWSQDPQRLQAGSREGRNRAVEEFSLDSTGRRWTQIIRDVRDSTDVSEDSIEPPGLSALVFAPFFPPAYLGGGPIRSLWAIVQEGKSRHRVAVITRDHDLDDSPLSVDRDSWIFEDGFTIRYASTRSPWRYIGALISSRSRPADALYVNSFFDVSLSMVPQLLAVFGWWGSVHRVVAVRGEFGSAALEKSPVRKALLVRLYRWLRLHRGVIWHASSVREAEDIRSVIGEGAEIIIRRDARSGEALRSVAPRTEAGRLQAVFLGRIVQHKGLTTVLEALGGSSTELDLDIYGPDEDVAYARLCREAATRLPDGVRVRFMGRLLPDDVCPTLANYDVLLMPTHGENFGHVIAEALSVGVPVMVCDVTPWTETVRCGGGVLVSGSSPLDWRVELERYSRLSVDQRDLARADALKAFMRWESATTGDGILDDVARLLQAQTERPGDSAQGLRQAARANRHFWSRRNVLGGSEGTQVAADAGREMGAAEVKAVQLALLDSFIEMCGREGLRVYLCAGSLLGAVRHEGFIPWDDDIDLMMPRADFERLRDITTVASLPPFVTIAMPGSSPDYPYPYAKVQDARTTLVERSDFRAALSVNIDVFPLDRWPASKWRLAVNRAALSLLMRLMALRAVAVDTPSRASRRLILRALKPLVSLLEPESIARLQTRVARSASNGKLMGVLVWGYQELVPIECYGTPGQLPFEGRKLPVPSNPTEILRRIYGDYLSLPSPDQQVSHHDYSAYWVDDS